MRWFYSLAAIYFAGFVVIFALNIAIGPVTLMDTPTLRSLDEKNRRHAAETES